MVRQTLSVCVKWVLSERFSMSFSHRLTEVSLAALLSNHVLQPKLHTLLCVPLCFECVCACRVYGLKHIKAHRSLRLQRQEESALFECVCETWGHHLTVESECFCSQNQTRILRIFSVSFMFFFPSNIILHLVADFLMHYFTLLSVLLLIFNGDRESSSVMSADEAKSDQSLLCVLMILKHSGNVCY